jgi:hypothetical protein
MLGLQKGFDQTLKNIDVHKRRDANKHCNGQQKSEKQNYTSKKTLIDNPEG